MGVAVIHVVDDQAHASKDFRCDIKMLLAHMKLLAADLQDVPGQDIEITVKCDISTFAWLMAYVKAESRSQQPQSTLGNCLQLLLASHYLQMSPVLKSSVAYIATKLLALAPAAAAQLCSLDSCLLDKLANAVQEETLEALHQTHHQQQQPQQPVVDSPANSDPKHSQSNSSSDGGSSSSCACALVEKLYKHKLRALLQQQNSTVMRCKACAQVFASAIHHKLQCPAGEAPQNRQYKLPLHEPDQAWDLQTFLAQQRTATNKQQQKQKPDQHQQPHGTQQEQALDQQPHEQQQEPSSWRELYWLVWGYVVVMYCQRCCSHFPARLLHQCSYHPLPAVFTSDEVIGQYPCCGAPAWQPGGNAAVAAAAASLQPCCSRDHDAYIPAGGSWQGQQGPQQPGAVGKGPKGGKDAPVDPKRALQLLRLFGPVITAAAPASLQQQQQQKPLMPLAAARQPAEQKQREPALPLLVKMVNRGASAAAAAAAAPAGSGDGLSAAAVSGSGTGSKTPGSQPASRPSSVSPLPPISPRQWSAEQQQHDTRPTTSSSAQLQQGQSYSVPAAVAAAMAAAAAAANSPSRASLYSATTANGHTADAAGSASSSGSGSSSSSNDSEGTSSSSGSSSEADEQVEYLDIDDAAADGEHEFNLLSGAHATPLSSVMGAVRAAAEARTKGVGLSSSTAGSSAGRMHQMGAPLAETFSAGGRRVLTTGGRKPLHSSNLLDTNSRPSTAASLLSLSGKQQQRVGQSPSRPGTSSSVGRMACMSAAAGGGGAGRVESATGGLSAVGAAFNRTLLLELVQQDDAYRMGILMRKLDSMRLQPPPDCGGQRQVQQGQQQQLTQVDVMKAVNGVLFEGKYA